MNNQKEAKYKLSNEMEKTLCHFQFQPSRQPGNTHLQCKYLSRVLDVLGGGQLWQ